MGKIALITGGSRGLGKSGALHLAAKGVNCIITYNQQLDKANEVVDEIRAMGRKAAAIHLDVENISSLDAFVEEVSKTLNSEFSTDKFNYLINNAGIGATIPFQQMTEEIFDRFVNIHFKSVYFLCQKINHLINDNGCVLNISSGTTRFFNFGYSIYASMKGAVEVFTRYLAKELGPRGIRVNVLAPGGTATDFNNAAIRSNPNIQQHIAGQTALGRYGQADDIGKIIAMLCSDDSAWINGQRIEASGGINL